MLERCQLEPLRPDQCQRQQPGTGTGSRPPPPTICTGTHPAQQIAPPVQTEDQSSSAPRAAALAFSFAPPSRLPGLSDQQPGARWVLSAAAPGKSWKVPGERWTQYPDITPTTCTASAAPMTPQPTSCTACTPCQTSQQPAAHRQHLPTPHPASPAAHLPQQITPPTAKNHPPQPAAGGVRFFT